MLAAVGAPSPPPAPSVAPWTSNDAVPLNPAVGVNLSPAAPSATVMKVFAAIGVKSFLKSAPLLMLVILKCVTSAPSTALGVTTRPDVVVTLTSVVAGVTDGGSATGL